MRVVYFYGDLPIELNCSIFNCFNPVKAINKLGGEHKADLLHISKFVENSTETRELIDKSDLLVLERNLFSDVLTMAAYWTARNKNLIGIWDDSYDKMVNTNVSWGFWTNGDVSAKDENGKEVVGKMLPPPLTQFKLTLKLLKGAQVVSKKLAEDWSVYTRTYHVNNYLNMDRYKDAKPLYKHDDIYLLWVGSLSHLYSFQNSNILRALKKICKTYKNVKVLIGGDKRVYDVLDLGTDKKLFQSFVPEDMFASLLKTATIGLAPLSGAYDERRSWIKCLEYQVLKIPWIASNLCTYDELKDYGMLVENTWQAWEHGLSEMIDHLPTYQEKADTIAYDFSLTQNIDKNIEKTLALYQTIIDGPHNI
jgi:glycosyltransferase involved in cell wall biosynthesis